MPAPFDIRVAGIDPQKRVIQVLVVWRRYVTNAMKEGRKLGDLYFGSEVVEARLKRFGLANPFPSISRIVGSTVGARRINGLSVHKTRPAR